VEQPGPTATDAGLTARGAATRSRIVATAAELMHVQGVGATTLDDVLRAGKASKSQFYRHFDDKPALVRAVIEQVGRQTIGRERETLQRVASLEELDRWRDALIERNAAQGGRYGCPLGSLASEVADQDPVARRMLEALFEAWRELFEGVIGRLQAEGILPEELDVAPLATGFVAAVQGGYLLAQTARDVTPMAFAIDMAIAHLRLLAGARDPAHP